MSVIGARPNQNLKTVIYATNFSLSSQKAGEYAARIAAYFSATLLVVHTFTLSQAAMEVESVESHLSAQRKDLMSLLSKQASHLSSNTVEAVSTLLEGDPNEVIPSLADRNSPSMVVLGTHGGSRLERRIVGSTAEKILRSTNCPSLSVGPLVRPVNSTKFPFESILFASDFTPSGARAAALAVSFAETLGAKIDVLNVIQEDDIGNPDRLSILQTKFYGALDGLVPQQAKEFCDPKTFVADGKAHDLILKYIREKNIDLLVLGIQKTSHLGMEMRSSRAFQLIVDAECPVLTISG